MFSQNEIVFLESLEEARIATVHNDLPHVKPVSYIFYENTVLIATDYPTRTLKNVMKNPNVALTIDIYKSGGHKAVLIQGIAQIVENGEEFKKFYDMFYSKFAWVRKEPWKENEAPFLRITPKHKVSWGLK